MGAAFGALVDVGGVAGVVAPADDQVGGMPRWGKTGAGGIAEVASPVDFRGVEVASEREMGAVETAEVVNPADYPSRRGSVWRGRGRE